MPASFVAFVGLLGLVVLAPVVVKATTFVLARRRRTCPACGGVSLVMTGGALGARLDQPNDPERRGSSSWAEYECERCQASYVRPLGGQLVARRAWLAGADEPIPTATVVRSRD